MEDCPTEEHLSAYHDGELTGDERAVLARHLAWCQACARQLEQLRSMSAFFSSQKPHMLSQIALRRLHSRLDEVMERGLIHWAWEVSGIAAAILLVGSIWLAQLGHSQLSPQLSALRESATVSVAVPPWIGAQASVDPVVREAPTPAAACIWRMRGTLRIAVPEH